MSDSTDQALRRLQRTVDSLVRRFDDEGLSAAERFRVGRAIEQRYAELRAQRMRAEAHDSRMGVDGPWISRTPEPGFFGREGPGVAAMLSPPIPPQAMARGWMGMVVSGAPREIHVERNELKMRFLSYPEILSVDPSSPAQRAGLAPGDTLLAYDGRDVRGTEISMTKLLRPDARVMVRVRRDGRVRELPVVVAEAPQRIRLRRDEEIRDAREPWIAGMPPDGPFPGVPAAAPAPRIYTPRPARPATAPTLATTALAPVFDFAPSGVAGAQLVTVSEGLKRSLGVQWGVLVATVPVGAPAYESGLQEGDVIVKVETQPVRTVLDVRQLVARAESEGERSVALEVIRGKLRRSVTLRW
jgi:serine protease Do